MTELKRCPDCGQDKPRDQFSRNRSRADGLQAYCKPCCYRRNQEDRATVATRNPELAAKRAAKKAAGNRRWLLANPDKMREYGRRSREANAEQRREQQRQANGQIRAAVFDHYGWSCACCGNTEDPTVDHVNGDGKAHLDELFGRGGQRAGYEFYRWLIKSGFPQGFQTLCRRCNTSKGTGPACQLDHSKAAKATQVAELKRRVRDLESQLAALSKPHPRLAGDLPKLHGIRARATRVRGHQWDYSSSQALDLPVSAVWACCWPSSDSGPAGYGTRSGKLRFALRAMPLVTGAAAVRASSGCE